MQEELKPCWCGSTDIQIDHYFGDGGLWWRVQCKECLSSSIMSGDQATVEREWNTRAEQKEADGK